MTFQDARDLVAGNPDVRDIYPADDFEVAEYGWQDESKFLIVAGTQMDVTGEGDPDTLTLDAPTFYVDKTTGDVSVIYGLKSYKDPTAGMNPVGPVPA